MAIAPEQFGLKTVMQRVWREGLEEDERKLLAKYFRGIDETNGPDKEQDLMVAQVAVMIPDLTRDDKISHATNLGEWFSKPSEHARLKYALNHYTYLIAKILFEKAWEFKTSAMKEHGFSTKEAALFNDWIDALSDYLEESSAHIATLNYDGFLYDNSLIFQNHSDGFKGQSPIWQSKFAQRKPRYLHLHGSPLFWEAEGHIEKLSVADYTTIEEDINHHLKFRSAPDFDPHIILSDGALKPLLIARSKVLSAYWKELENILLNDNPEEIILFGYGGGDDHLNRLIGEPKCPVRVVERRKGHNIPDQEKVWKKRLNGATDVFVDLRKNILTFDEWAARPAESKMENDA
jgi:hypothetical protein